jgi:hypothetical protein
MIRLFLVSACLLAATFGFGGPSPAWAEDAFPVHAAVAPTFALDFTPIYASEPVAPPVQATVDALTVCPVVAPTVPVRHFVRGSARYSC